MVGRAALLRGNSLPFNWLLGTVFDTAPLEVRVISTLLSIACSRSWNSLDSIALSQPSTSLDRLAASPGVISPAATEAAIEAIAGAASAAERRVSN